MQAGGIGLTSRCTEDGLCRCSSAPSADRPFVFSMREHAEFNPRGRVTREPPKHLLLAISGWSATRTEVGVPGAADDRTSGASLAREVIRYLKTAFL